MPHPGMSRSSVPKTAAKIRSAGVGNRREMSGAEIMSLTPHTVMLPLCLTVPFSLSRTGGA